VGGKLSDFTGMAFTTVAVVVGTTELRRVADQKWNTANPKAVQRKLLPVMSPVIGGFVLGVFLFALGMVNEYLANLFCILLIVSALLINGISVFSLFN
jgi:hypothetical protein